MPDRSEVLNLVGLIARATVDKTQREHPTKPVMPGTVVAYDGETSPWPTVQVVVDGASPENPSTAFAPVGGPWEPQQRVLVMYVEPNGAWVLGPTIVPPSGESGEFEIFHGSEE